MLRALGGVDEAYAPAYVEDLDLGYRAWLRGWPTVYVAGAVVEHRHRATTARYYSKEQLATILEINYLRFLARAVASPRVFRRLWRRALRRLRLRAATDPAARAALRAAAGFALAGGPAHRAAYREESLLALTDGSVACFPGRAAHQKTPALVIVRGWEYVPDKSDGHAILLVRVAILETPPAPVLARFVEIVEARTDAAFRAALPWIRRKWRIAD